MPLNVYAHLATTGLAYLGALGLALAYFLPPQAPQAPKTPKAAKGSLGPLRVAPLCAGLAWALARYTVPDDDVAFAAVGVAYVGGALASGLQLTAAQSAALVGVGVVGQELAHWWAAEATYLAAYVNDAAAVGGAAAWAGAAATLVLHNVWLLPFELRAGINALTAALVPAAAA